MSKTVNPYKESNSTKKEQVEEMFDNISGKYDFLNRFFTLGIDVLWRKKAVKYLRQFKPKQILDVATGTGDFAIQLSQLDPDRIVGLDLSKDMLEVGKKKIAAKSLDSLIEMVKGDSENLPFDDNTFDAVTVAFGVRNFENLEKGLSEMQRVLKPNGNMVIIELSKPTNKPFKKVFFFYFKKIMPAIGRVVSKDNSAYTYLPESVEAFPSGKEFTDILEKVGLKSKKNIRLSGGIATIYVATK